MFANVEIRSKNKKSLNKFIHFLTVLTSSKSLNLKIDLQNLNRLKKKKRITLLKSPHVNKKSQEHFKYVLTSKLFGIKTVQIFKFLIMLKKLQKVTNFDTQILLKFRINSNKIKSFKLINPRIHKQIDYTAKVFNTILFKKYVILFDIYGSLKFYLDSSVG